VSSARPAHRPAPSDRRRRVRFWGKLLSWPASVHTDPLAPQSLPRIESLGSRQFLQRLLPALCTVPSALRPLHPTPLSHYARTRALDVGAGIGRVACDTLLPLFDDVVLLEPVPALIHAAVAAAKDNAPPPAPRWKGLAEQRTSATFLQGTLQDFDPLRPHTTATHLARVGFAPDPPDADAATGFDVVWCQWCLMYLSDVDLVAFLRRARAALRSPENGLVVVKENVCRDGEGGERRVRYDEEDSSVTRCVRAPYMRACVRACCVLTRV